MHLTIVALSRWCVLVLLRKTAHIAATLSTPRCRSLNPRCAASLIAISTAWIFAVRWFHTSGIASCNWLLNYACAWLFDFFCRLG